MLSSSPSAERTHWQQVRFLLKGTHIESLPSPSRHHSKVPLRTEPLAVNAYETIRGWMRLTVNSQRSYDVIAEIVTGKDASLADPKAPTVPSKENEEVDRRLSPGGSGRRQGKWGLHEQCYWYDTGVDYTRPEFLAMYSPDLLEGNDGDAMDTQLFST